MKRRNIAISLALIALLGVFSGCNTDSSHSVESTEAVTLTIAGGWTDCKALDDVARNFTQKYPNCQIVYEYLQDYNNSLIKRLSGENQVDLLFTTNIQKDSNFLPYVLDLNREDIDLSNTFGGLIENFKYKENDTVTDKIYAVPLGAEMRGCYVNKTLLDSLGIAIPTNQETFLAACEILKEHGYIPIHGNPGAFGQTILYPWIANTIANANNYQEMYDKIENREDGFGEIFKEQLNFLYSLVEKGYYDYKRAQTEFNLFVANSDEDYACDFLNIALEDEKRVKKDDMGQVAFLPAPMSLKSVIDRTKEDYHSNIEYVFIPTPTGEDGGYVYLSPAHGIAVNKNSSNLEWGIKFIDFLFSPENNKVFASSFNIVPNTSEAFAYISSLYDVPNDRISELGQVTFGYNFYGIICETLIDISKANNPKYMKTEDDGSVSMYPLEYYLNSLEESVKDNDNT